MDTSKYSVTSGLEGVTYIKRAPPYPLFVIYMSTSCNQETSTERNLLSLIKVHFLHMS